jgi:MFS family permease
MQRRDGRPTVSRVVIRRLAYLGCSFSIGTFSAFNNFTLTLWLTGFTGSYLLLGLLGNTRSLEGSIVSPLVGRWSDGVWLGRLGRRRPFILVGGLLSAALLALTPWISRAPLLPGLETVPPDLGRLAPPMLAIFLFTLAFNAMDDVHKALLADVAGPAERNGLSALSVVVDMGGQVVLLALGFALWGDYVPDSAFVITGILVAAGVLLTVVGVAETVPGTREAGRRPTTGLLPRQSARTVLARYRGAGVFCLVTFSYWSGINAVMPLVSVYSRDILGATVGEAQLLPGLMLLSTSLLAIPMGRLGGRYGKRRVIGAGYAIMACAALAALLITTTQDGAIVFMLAGVGSAASFVLTIPLLADLVPRRHMGFATGILAASGSLAAPLASLVAGSLSDLYGPRAIFGLMAAAIAVALALLPFARPSGHEATGRPPRASLASAAAASRWPTAS